jgi:putative ABC transport system permease protein
MVGILARYASRFSVRALDLTVDSSMLWVGAGLAVVAAVLLAFVPRLPSADMSNGLSVASGGVRITGSTGRRLRIFAITQIAASFMLLAGAGMLVKTLLALQSARTGFDLHNVLALNVPVMSYGKTPDQVQGFYKEAMRQIAALLGVDRVAVGTVVPWRDAGLFGPGFRSRPMGTCELQVKKILARNFELFRQDFSRRWEFPSFRDVISTTPIEKTPRKS